MTGHCITPAQFPCGARTRACRVDTRVDAVGRPILAAAAFRRLSPLLRLSVYVSDAALPLPSTLEIGERRVPVGTVFQCQVATLVVDMNRRHHHQSIGHLHPHRERVRRIALYARE